MNSKIIISACFLLACFSTYAQSQLSRTAFSNAAYRFTDESNEQTYGDTVYYYTMWGQSNMVGRDSVTRIPIANSYLQSTIPGAFISPGDTLLGLLVPGNWGGDDERQGEFGPVVSMADTLFKATADTVFLLNYAYGSTTLATRWNAQSGDLFIGLKQRISAFESRVLLSGKWPVCLAVIGMQGEDDAVTLAHANAYDTNLENFIDSLRNFYNDTDLPFIFGEVNGINDPAMAYRTTVRQAQYDVIRYEISSGGTSSNTAYTKDHTYLIDTDTYTFSDVVHYDAESTVQFGWDIFMALQIAGIISPSP